MVPSLLIPVPPRAMAEILLLLVSVVMVPWLLIPAPEVPVAEIWPLLFRVVRVIPDWL